MTRRKRYELAMALELAQIIQDDNFAGDQRVFVGDPAEDYYAYLHTWEWLRVEVEKELRRG